MDNSESLLDNLVRVKLAHLIKPGDSGERIVLYEHLNDERHLTELELTTEQAVELQFAVVLGKMKASSFEGYIIEERQYREIRAAGWHDLLW